MTEPKRAPAAVANSTAAPPLSQKSSTHRLPHGPGELDAALSKAIGARVKLTTSVPQITLEGTLFTACPSSNLIAIAVAPTSQSTTKPAAHDVPFPSPSSSSGPASDYHILPVSRLTSFSLLSLADTNISTSPSLFDSPVDLRALRTREAAAVKTARERVARRGVGVSVEAQDIFDALARTLPTRWAGTSIVVSDAVVIGPPYEVEDCAAPKESVTALARVKRVLENEKRKIAERRARGSAAKEGGERAEEARKGG